MNFGTYLANKILGVTLLRSSYTSPSTLYVSLGTSLDSFGDSYQEVATGSYSRQIVAFGVPSRQTTRNTNLVTFPAASGSWGNIKHFAIHDALTSGNLLYWGTLANSGITISTSQVFQTFVNSLAVRLY